MKIKWSWIIVLALGGFITMIVSFGIRMMNSDSELYEGDYYQKGENYSAHMKQERLGHSINAEYLESKSVLEISHDSIAIKLSSVTLIKLSDAGQDRLIRNSGNPSTTLRVPLGELQGENWIAEIRGTIGEEAFFKKIRL
jgi:hypothetical protein